MALRAVGDMETGTQGNCLPEGSELTGAWGSPGSRVTWGRCQCDCPAAQACWIPTRQVHTGVQDHGWSEQVHVAHVWCVMDSALSCPIWAQGFTT